MKREPELRRWYPTLIWEEWPADEALQILDLSPHCRWRVLSFAWWSFGCTIAVEPVA